MRVTRIGATALLLVTDDPPAWYAELVRRRSVGDLTAVEIVPAARTVLLDGVPDPVATADAIAGWSALEAAPAVGAGQRAEADQPVRVPTRYDGPDLPAVAGRWGTSVDEAVRRHTAIEFRVAFCGFAPGFAYLSGLPPPLRVPRHPTPRPQVPAGSVAIAGEYAAIYPASSPGGWQVLGRTDLPLFDLTADPPTRLLPGARVRFEAI